MSDVAIRIEGLGKRYRLGQRERYKALRDVLAQMIATPLRRLSQGVRSRPTGAQQSPTAVWALKDVTLEVPRGEILGIIGPNGAGKTTLLKILSRITEPTEGYAEIHGRMGSLLEVGTGFHPELTGRENIYLNGAILGMKKAELHQKFDEIVDFAEVEKFIDTPIKHYSSGMYVRLAFAVAAHLEPDILLVDEVLAVGDAAFQKKCLAKIEGVNREGRTVLFVSHNMNAVASLCERGILLSQGRVVMDDSVDRAVACYLSTVQVARRVSDGTIALVDHEGRRKKTDQLVQLRYCRLLDGAQQPVSFFRSGEEARIAIGYKMARPVESGRLVFTLTVNDGQQRRLFSCSSELVGCEWRGLPETGEVQCVIPKLPLVTGTYSLNLGCRLGAGWSDGVYDAAEFEVVAGKFYRTGLLPPEGWGYALVEHAWVPASEGFRERVVGEAEMMGQK